MKIQTAVRVWLGLGGVPAGDHRRAHWGTDILLKEPDGVLSGI